MIGRGVPRLELASFGKCETRARWPASPFKVEKAFGEANFPGLEGLQAFVAYEFFRVQVILLADDERHGC